MGDKPNPKGTFKEPVQVVRNTVNTEKTPARVGRIIINGVARTKDDIVLKQVEHMVESKTLFDVILGSVRAKNDLERLGIFKDVTVEIDTCKVPRSPPDAYDVHINVEEKTFGKGGIQTQADANSINMQYSFGFPNVFGRAEKLMGEYTHGTKQDRGYGLHFTKPLNGCMDILLGSNGYQSHTTYPQNGFRETNRGLSADISFPSHFGRHKVKWEGVWRDLRCMTNTTSFAVREQAGHTLKSSLIHELVMDGRDDPLLPRRGAMIKFLQEFAGLGGNARFFKQDVEFQANAPLLLDSVLQFSAAAGVMRPLSPNKNILLNDRFFLGGPLTLRGFNSKGVGPSSDGDVLGGDAYCMAALHVYTPLPFRPSAGGFWDMFRTHVFVNAGNIGRLQDFSMEDLNSGSLETFKNSCRIAYGAGLVLRLGFARLELNYTIPLQSLKGDSMQPGVQLGVGFSFL